VQPGRGERGFDVGDDVVVRRAEQVDAAAVLDAHTAALVVVEQAAERDGAHVALRELCALNGVPAEQGLHRRMLAAAVDRRSRRNDVARLLVDRDGQPNARRPRASRCVAAALCEGDDEVVAVDADLLPRPCRVEAALPSRHRFPHRRVRSCRLPHQLAQACPSLLERGAEDLVVDAHVVRVPPNVLSACGPSSSSLLLRKDARSLRRVEKGTGRNNAAGSCENPSAAHAAQRQALTVHQSPVALQVTRTLFVRRASADSTMSSRRAMRTSVASKFAGTSSVENSATPSSLPSSAKAGLAARTAPSIVGQTPR
jgi:hypothetical protein